MERFELKGKLFEVMINRKDGWNPEAFSKRYSEILDKYDYIVGDWGYGQLRLKGFFSDSHPKVSRETRFAHVDEYIHEFCNFGCAYFVLRRLNPVKPHSSRNGKHRARRSSRMK
ncbi:MAG: YutD family protein [Firmicutes bacterium]|uniref:Uncharacterized protein YutD n=1 Tax=Melghirimyces thermohalophilus TaxID=1236220 RepID=A0A1G6L390_9BACL|nr:YutD family protein [Melghirimyces thermohalophilus]MDA8353087.1 YutD family protein [Bacillota bacterium]SDC37568.1 Uncharacterized protein YutD [Melghirimyces thermohalophilus]